MDTRLDTKRFILTGAPGSGKTSVIKALEKLGHVVIHEAATDLIAAEQCKGIIDPWMQADFLTKCVLIQKARQANAEGKLQFYDRSPFCSYALGNYLSRGHGGNFIPTGALAEEINRCLEEKIYQNKVFLLKNLGFIEHTEARKISFEDALIFEKIHLDVYQEFGFEIVFVSKKSVEERCEFISSLCN